MYYFGYQLITPTTLNGIPLLYDLVPASTDERLAQHVDHAIQSELAPLGVTPGEFYVLATFRRADGPFQLNPTMLYPALMISSGAMTNRLDRLEQAGYVKRLPDPQDRRSTLVQLIDRGMRFTIETLIRLN